MILDIKIDDAWHQLGRRLLPYTKDGLRDPNFWLKKHKFSFKIDDDGFLKVQIDDEDIANEMI